MKNHKSLDEFAEECGVTDDAREGVELNPPDSGHVLRASSVDDYWRGLTEVSGSTHPAYSIVPAGSLVIVLDADEDVVTRGWGSDEPLERGVYLEGRAEVGTKPPAPIEVDDDYLRFAAEAALLAVDDAAADNDEVVAIAKNHLSLSFAVRGMETGDQERLVEKSDDPTTYPRERPDELYYGFTTVRRFGTPYKAYTQVEAPRLDLDDLNEEWS